MKKKMIMVCMAVLLVFSLTACGGQEKKEVKKTDKKNTEEKQDTSDEKDKEAEVELTLPASFFDEEGMAGINDKAKAEGVTDITVNEDGSVTYKMKKSVHEKLLAGVKESIDSSIAEMKEDKETYPSYADITYNEDMTEFQILVDAASYSGMEAFGALPLYVFGNLYQGMNLIEEGQANTVVKIVNKDTQEVIESGDSASMADEYQGE